MQFSSRMMVASHILLYLAEYQADEKVTSNVLADTTGVNPVNIRKILAKLKSAGLVEIKAGVGGVKLCKDLKDISLAGLYDAVEDQGTLFPMHEHPNVNCPVGASVHAVMEQRSRALDRQLHDLMADMKLSDLYSDMKLEIARISETKS